MDQYAVFGHPIVHSQSPFIHARFAGQTGEALEYTARDVAEESFDEEVRAFFARGGKGLNITVPHKRSAWQLCDRRGESAEKAGAVNTLYTDDEGHLSGENTDGIGMVRDITDNHGGRIEGRRVLLLGAGGAVRGIMPALLAQGPATVVIANRTLARAQELVADFGDEADLQAVAYDAVEERPFDLIINGTSAGLLGELPPVPPAVVTGRSWCYDMVYAAGRTVFQQWAEELGAERALDGCGMLVEQAAESFRIWRGVRPDTAPVIEALRQRLA